MAIGDAATAAGFPLVPDSGDAGEVKLGAQEINRTRDMVAGVLGLIPATWPVTKGGTGAADVTDARTNLGISTGTDAASDAVGGSVDGNIYFRIVS
jgi:hypothetical protein